MSWTLETTDALGAPAVAVIRNAEFGDRDQTVRRQNHGFTDGGALYVQDLLVEDRRIEAVFTGLTNNERAALLAVVRAAGYRSRDFSLTIVGGGWPVPLNTGQVNACTGLPINTGQGLNTGQSIQAAVALIPGLRLDQSEVAFEQQRNGMFSTTLRFYQQGGPIPT